jgi:hypothetical protein
MKALWNDKKSKDKQKEQTTVEQNKTATICGGRGSAGVADALKCDLFLSIQRCSQAQQTRSLPPRAGIGKVGVLERALFHPDFEITPEGDWLQGD